jgi:hypothetical protein
VLRVYQASALFNSGVGNNYSSLDTFGSSRPAEHAPKIWPTPNGTFCITGKNFRFYFSRLRIMVVCDQIYIIIIVVVVVTIMAQDRDRSGLL